MNSNLQRPSRGLAAAVAAAMSSLAISLTGSLTGCATTPPEVSDGQHLIATGHIEEGLALLERAAKTPPFQPQVYTVYVTQRDAVISVYVRDGDSLRLAGDLDGAEARYRSGLKLDPNSATANAGLRSVQRDRRLIERAALAQQSLAQGDTAAAEKIAREVLGQDGNQRDARAVMKTITERRESAQSAEPKLKASLSKSISLELRDAPLHTVFEMMSRTAGINFVLDHDVKGDQRTSIFVKDTSLDDILKVLLLTNQLTRKVLNDNSVLIYPNTPAKLREYQELTMRSFYIANADVKQTAALIREMVKTKDIFVDEKLNLLIMRDTPEAIRLAEQLIATQDLPESEVVLDVEVLEVSTTVVEQIGLQYPESISTSLLGGVTDASGNAQIGGGNRLHSFIANPALVLNLSKLDGVSNILANPHIRVKNREKAHIHIGEKVPVVTTTSTANVGVSSSVNYLDTGIKLDVEPNIYRDGDVGIKVELEVSNIESQLNISGTIAYRLGTRNASTLLRLKDGETQMLAGLIDDEDRRSTNKVPFLADFPILGELFKNNNNNGAKQEIVLLITPRVVRRVVKSDSVPSQFSSGTEALPSTGPVRLTSDGPATVSLSSESNGGAGAGAAASANVTSSGATTTMSFNTSGPASVAVGDEFAVSVTMQSNGNGGGPVEAVLNANYDARVLQPMGGSASGPISIPLTASTVAGVSSTPATIRFKVIGTKPTTTQVQFEVASSSAVALDPPEVNIAIVAKPGTK